jgi:hypothetical protein
MADAKKCDRCGKLYETKIQNINAIEQITNDAIEAVKKIEIALSVNSAKIILHEITDRFDLCKECKKSFKKWFRKAEEDGRSEMDQDNN